MKKKFNFNSTFFAKDLRYTLPKHVLTLHHHTIVIGAYAHVKWRAVPHDTSGSIFLIIGPAAVLELLLLLLILTMWNAYRESLPLVVLSFFKTLLQIDF